MPHIIAKHIKNFLQVCERGEDLTRDLFISEQDVCNMAGKLAIDKHDKNDTQFVHMWVQKNPILVYYYKETKVKVTRGLNRKKIAIQIAWQQMMMLKHGHKNAVSIEATFATNKNKTTLLLPWF